MKAPHGYNKNIYLALKSEAKIIEHYFCIQRLRSEDDEHWLSVQITNPSILQLPVSVLYTLLAFFKCNGIYITKKNGYHGLFVEVRSDSCDNGILRSISRVQPIRVYK